MATDLNLILNDLREQARNNRDLGDRFERLMLRYFELDPIYADRFSNVWMWNDWPDKGNVGDVGIDLVARERATGEYCAIQCKFYLPEHTLSKADIDSFFTAAGREAFTSGMIVSTTDKWGKNAEDALNHQTKPFTRLSVHDLEASPLDWSKFDVRRPLSLKRLAKKKLYKHQQAALADVLQGLEAADRGKLIMACGTGKTFTALKIAEALAPSLHSGGGGRVLFLVPSLSLLSQTLREWTAEAERTIHSLAVCSDVNIGKSRKKNKDDTADITIHDLAFPATTNAKQLVAQHKALIARAKADSKTKLNDDKTASPASMTVVFSTYQSIDAVAKAQRTGLPDFDLIICDEAHRTTGVTLTGEDESHFVKVHDSDFLKATKRLYMTATPRLYGDDAKSKAKQNDAVLCSMDDPDLFGEELHRLGFGQAVSQALLTDYKVLVLAVDEKYVSKTFQKQIADENSQLNLDDAVKITGCWNGLAKHFEAATTTTTDIAGDAQPMCRAVAFSRSIKDSKAFVEKFGQIVNAYQELHPDANDLLDIQAEHVDGTFDALKRGALLDWIKDESPDNTCRILSNVRCLSEGVDVPALDAVMFLNPRNSTIDVVQSVGRVMRRAPDKRFGYIILPIGIPADMKPEEALKNNEKYKVVWQVLQALRAHDDRFNTTINQLELNKDRPNNIQVIGIGGGTGDDDGNSGGGGDGDSKPKARQVQGAFAFPELDEWKDAIYAKLVLKCGDRAYWETWARDIARIAEQHITRIKALLDTPDSPHKKAFAAFLAGLQANLNPAVTQDDAVEMLAQHLITKPVFDALFANYAFTEANPVSQSMQTMLDLLHEESLEKEAVTLEKFYASVRDRAKGLDNAAARQSVIIELYDEFFKNAFPRMHKRLGIVYTPVEVVDFIIHSVQDILQDQFNSGLGDQDVHIIDPFTGTGTFLVRLLQSGLIAPEDLPRKYKEELHANEIVLLAYYIAAINIEETYHGLLAENSKKESEYEPFEGIVLTDTFQMYESQHGESTKFTGHFPENSKRAKRQQQSPIRVVIANPPYSVNDNPVPYRALDARIEVTYAAKSTANNKNSLYDSYVRAIRWASDRIAGKGIVGFVSNGSYIDGNAADGIRACITDEFTSVYVFNLRGNQRTSGETSRQEGGKVFGSGSRTPVAITLLIKNPDHKGKCRLYYHDIGDYLTRDDKLKTIRRFASINGVAKAKQWHTIKPNAEHDWINQRDPAFESFIPLNATVENEQAIFADRQNGVQTNRDAWVYSYSRERLATNLRRTIDFYMSERDRITDDISGIPQQTQKETRAKELLNADDKAIKWTSSLIADLCRGKSVSFTGSRIGEAIYRPFSKLWIYYDPQFNHRYKERLFPTISHHNPAISATGVGATKEFSSLIVDILPDLEAVSKGQCFPLYVYEKVEEDGKLGFDDGEIIDGYRRRDAITDGILKTFREAYGKKITKEDIFYYVYGVLHSPEYRTRFAADLKKMLPRIPLTQEAKDFRKFSKAGRGLAEWHLNYETVEPCPLVEHIDKLTLDPGETLKIKKMTFARPTAEQKAEGLKYDKTQIIYNSHITLSHIPLEAYDYVVNGKPAIEWIMERYQVTRDKNSGIVNDPNDWCAEHNDPRYIIDLIARVVRVSIETMKIVNALPALNER